MSIKHPPSVRAYFERVGAEPTNFRRAVVATERKGYRIERAVIRIDDQGLVTCNVKEFAPYPEEVAAMQEELQGMDFPRVVSARAIDLLLPHLKGPYYEFYDQRTGEIQMVQERNLDPSSSWKYRNWSFMSNGEWMVLEPDLLPFWKPRERRPGAPIMVHEGAKAAHHVTTAILTDIDKRHCWSSELPMFEHWGIVGGAFAPHRARWDELLTADPPYVVYACDNDTPGESALHEVSRRWGRNLRGLVFGKSFPPGWDMADPVPDDLYTEHGRYAGPTMDSLMVPATWATLSIPNPSGKGRPTFEINPYFAEEWYHCITPEVYMHKDWPSQMFSEKEFNNKVQPFSGVKETAQYLRKNFPNKADYLVYDPSQKPGMFTSDRGRYFNTFQASKITPLAGDPTPFLEFMENFVPDASDRHNLLRWTATLIAKPEVRIIYGVLLISETQGVGKGTYGEKILAPLIGDGNVSYPSESTIVDSNYNYWLAHKRLAVVHEIYAGNSSKAYNKLKNIITDKNIEIEKKYQATYLLDSWVHIVACSNSPKALQIAADDRRWFVPKVTEEKRDLSYWEGLIKWLNEEDGLRIVAHWAHEFVKTPDNCVTPGERAPGSATKEYVVRETYSPGQNLVDQVLTEVEEAIAANRLPATTFLMDTDLVQHIKNNLYDGKQSDRLEKPLTCRKVAKARGWHIGEIQAQIAGWDRSARGGRVLSRDPEIAKKTPGELKEKGLRPLNLSQFVGL